MTVCMIGNSHIVALKEASEYRSDLDFSQVRWLWAPGRSLGTLQVEAGILSSRDEATIERLSERNDQASVVIAEQSAFVIVGLGISPLLVAEMYRDSRLFRHATPKTHLISRALFDANARASISAVTGLRIAKLIRQYTDVPIALVSQPATLATSLHWTRPALRRGRVARPAISARFDKYEKLANLYKQICSENLGEFLFDEYSRALRDVAMHEHLHALPQPADTLQGGMTLEIYLRQHATRPSDLIHTNRDYGSRIIDQLLSEFMPFRSLVS